MRRPGPFRDRLSWLFLACAILSINHQAAAQDAVLTLDPVRTVVQYTLGDVLHTVHGTFQLKQGTLDLDPASGNLSGEIIVDATSGQSGTAMRDRKMHREVLESSRYPEITFRPDRVEGAVSLQGKSSVKVHGIFSIHGADHEVTVPAEVEMTPQQWTATVHFSVPYVAWGMKNPSNFFLRVSPTVEIDIEAAGSLARR